jgi:carbonic anhydrase
MGVIKVLKFCLLLFFIFLTTNLWAEEQKNVSWLYTQTSESQKLMTADKGIQILKEGNARFINGATKHRNLLNQVKLTHRKGQYPFAIILSCMDSRGSSDLIFDQGIGDIFSIRVAGNVLDIDQLGGLEFATKVVGTHLIVVMGHTSCGAIAGSCNQVKLGHLTQLLQKIQPALDIVKQKNKGKELNCQDKKTIDDIAKQNVLLVMQKIKQESKIISDLIAKGDVKIVGAMHNLKTGEVSFIE